MKNLFFLFIVVGGILSDGSRALSSVKTSSFCADFLQKRSPALEFTAYLETLFSSKTISKDHLLLLDEALKLDYVLNPLEFSPLVSPSQQIHKEALDEFLQVAVFSKKERDQISIWIKNFLETQDLHAVVREQTVEKTRMPFRELKMQFIPVEGFEVLETPVTQWQWAMLMENNPSKFKNSPESFVLKVNGKTIPMQPTHPVDSLTLIDVRKAIDHLNVWSFLDDRRIYGLIKDHRPKAHYRVPTMKEYKTLTSFAALDKLHPQTDAYGWSSANSRNQTQEVAQKRPIIIDGHALYDLFGNVFEWTEDTREGKLSLGIKILNLILNQTTDPNKHHHQYLLYGGCWAKENLYDDLTNWSLAHFSMPTYGFRLVRDKKPMKSYRNKY